MPKKRKKKKTHTEVESIKHRDKRVNSAEGESVF
jgi:hypothetical protein